MNPFQVPAVFVLMWLHSRTLRCWIVLTSGALVLAAGQLTAQSAATAPPVELPEFRIDESPVVPRLDSWSYLEAGDLEVLSSAPDRTTRQLLRRLLVFRRALTLAWPVSPRPLATTTVVLCGRRADFDRFEPARSGRDELNQLSWLFRNGEQAAIVVDCTTSMVERPAWAASGSFAGDHVEHEIVHAQQLYREYVRLLLSQAEVPLPPWLEEGLMQIATAAQVLDSSLVYGKVDASRGRGRPSNFAVSYTASMGEDGTTEVATVVGEQPFNVVLRYRRLLPLARFFTIDENDPEARNPLGNTLWAKQAYAFVHLCLFGEGHRHRRALEQFAERLRREPPSEALFKECFGQDYAAFEQVLYKYIGYTKHRYQRYRLNPGDRVSEKELPVRDATPAEIGVILGDALRLAGLPDRANEAYRASYLHGGRDPALLAGLGAGESAAGRIERAERLLEAAVKGGVARPSAYVELAKLRLQTGVAASKSPEGALAPTQIARVLDPLFEARKREPALPEVYQLIGDVWRCSAVQPTLEHLAVLDEGVRRFPRQSGLLLTCIDLYRRAGADAHAASIARLGLRFATPPTQRAEFELLLATLERERGAEKAAEDCRTP